MKIPDMIDAFEKETCLEAFKKPMFWLSLCAIASWVFASFGISLFSAVAFILAFWLILLTFIDLKHMILPDILTYSGIILGVILAPFHLDYTSSVVGGAFGFALFYGIYWGYAKLRGMEGMGFGDVKFLCMIGTWVGALQLPLVLLLASFTGIFFFIARALFYGKSGDVPMPFGPFLAMGCWLSFLYADTLWYGIFYTRNLIIGIIA